MLATPANMRAWEEKHPGRDGIDEDGGRHHVEGLRAVTYSPLTGEQYSASAGDYWNQADDEPLRDSTGEPMILVVPSTTYTEVEA